MKNKIEVPVYTLYNGEKIPCIGLGTFGSDKCSAQEIADAVKGAIDAGYTMFDCAACYGNEVEIGQIFKGFILTLFIFGKTSLYNLGK